MPAVLRDDTGPRRFFSAQDDCWHVQVVQGGTYVTGDRREVLTTVLGSCIAACIRDPVLGVGGMNHFLLPAGGGPDAHAARYGVNAMEILINEILRRGGVRARLEAKLFGGANVTEGLADIGSENARFAAQYLAAEGIALAGGDVGGRAARRIRYWPHDGRVRQMTVRDISGARLAEGEIASARQAIGQIQREGCDVELF